jgi:hypothetical protein
MLMQAAGQAEWRLPFDLARRLRTLADANPKRFRPAVEAFCAQLDLKFEDVWLGFPETRGKVIYAEGQDVLSVVAERAGTNPVEADPDLGASYNAVASLAYHRSTLAGGEPFYLPRERIAKWIGKTPMTASRNLHVPDVLKSPPSVGPQNATAVAASTRLREVGGTAVPNRRKSLKAVGIEPTTDGLKVRCSTS